MNDKEINDALDKVEGALKNIADKEGFLAGYAEGVKEAKREAEKRQSRLDAINPISLRAGFERAVAEMVNSHPGMTHQGALEFLLNQSGMTPWEPEQEMNWPEEPLNKIIGPDSLPGRDKVINFSNLTKYRYATPYKLRAFATREHAEKMREKGKMVEDASLNATEKKKIQNDIEADRVYIQYSVLEKQAEAEIMFWSMMLKRAREVIDWKEKELYQEVKAPKWFIENIKAGENAEKTWRGVSDKDLEPVGGPGEFRQQKVSKQEQARIDAESEKLKKQHVIEVILPNGSKMYARADEIEKLKKLEEKTEYQE